MLCIDTSSLVAYLEGAKGTDIHLVDQAFSDGVGSVSPVTVTEILSDPNLNRSLRELILKLPVLPIIDGFWERAGIMRAKLIRSGHKAKMADTLIAQNCMDHGAVLLTRDKDFKIFQRWTGLKVLP